MSAPRESGMQRIQVGIFGIVAVLVVISVANVMYNRTETPEVETSVSEEPELQAAEDQAVPEEPLAELGVAPPVEAEPKVDDTNPLPEAELDGPNTAPVE